MTTAKEEALAAVNYLLTVLEGEEKTALVHFLSHQPTIGELREYVESGLARELHRAGRTRHEDGPDAA